jgi:lysozyme
MTIVDQLKRDERVCAKPYRDTVGKLTIGVGRNLDDVGLSPDEIELLLRNDIERSRRDLFTHLPWVVGLDDARRGVLLNMCFNMGVHGLCEFRHMLTAVQAGDYETAAKEMAASLWAKQTGARADRLEIQMRTGQWQ